MYLCERAYKCKNKFYRHRRGVYINIKWVYCSSIRISLVQVLFSHGVYKTWSYHGHCIIISVEFLFILCIIGYSTPTFLKKCYNFIQGFSSIFRSTLKNRSSMVLKLKLITRLCDCDDSIRPQVYKIFLWIKEAKSNATLGSF